MRFKLKIRRKDAKKMLRETGYDDVDTMLADALSVGVRALACRKEREAVKVEREEPST